MSEVISYDTVIVGGGISGLYTCYKLKQLKGLSYKVSLFEGTGRFGGRIETVKMGGFLAEYGPMRFEKRAQPLLMELIAELGLKTKHFVPYTAAEDPDSLFDLTFEESGGKEHGRKLTTLELLSLGILRLLNASCGDMDNPEDPLHREWWATLDEEYYSYVRNEAMYKEKYLYKMGFWNALSLVLTPRTINKIIQYGTFYHLIHFNPNAAEWIIFWLRGLHPGDELVGIEQGTESLSRELVQRLNSGSDFMRLNPELNLKLAAELVSKLDFKLNRNLSCKSNSESNTELKPKLNSKSGSESNPKFESEFGPKLNYKLNSRQGPILEELNVPLHLNHMLTAFFPRPDGKILLKFQTGNSIKEVLAKNVVLALPRCPLMQLRQFLPENVRELVDSVIPIPLLKCFFVNEDPWWNEFTPPQTRASTIPAREIHYAFRKDKGSRQGIVMVYGDLPSLQYWTPFVQQKTHLKAEINLDLGLVEGYLQYLRSNPESKDLKAIKAESELISCFGIRDWSREPFEAGCHVWKAGVNVEKAIQELSAFSLPGSPFPDKNVHICGEAYSDFQGFIEGSLRTALRVLKQII